MNTKEKEIEKLFAEKLHQHPVTPPSESWNKLQRQLQQRTSQPTTSHRRWRVAAAVLLLLGAALLIRLAYVSQEELPVADTVPQQLPAPVEPERNTAAATTPNEVPVPAVKPHSHPLAAEQRISLPHPGTGTKSLAQPVSPASVPRLATVEKVPAQQVHRFSSSTTRFAASRQVSLAQIAVADPTAVTVTYRGKAPKATHKADGRTFAFLGQLKASAPSFSELRQAKDDLISRAFRND